MFIFYFNAPLPPCQEQKVAVRLLALFVRLHKDVYRPPSPHESFPLYGHGTEHQRKTKRPFCDEKKPRAISPPPFPWTPPPLIYESISTRIEDCNGRVRMIQGPSDLLNVPVFPHKLYGVIFPC